MYIIFDIFMAFIIALFIELFSIINGGKYIKRIIIVVMCITIIFIYFIRGCQTDFPWVGKMNFAIWITFVILFDELILLTSKILKKYIKE